MQHAQPYMIAQHSTPYILLRSPHFHVGHLRWTSGYSMAATKEGRREKCLRQAFCSQMLGSHCGPEHLQTVV